MRHTTFLLALLVILADYLAAQHHPSMTIVTWNIRHGRGSDDSVDIVRTAAALERLSPDIVALQEVDDSVERSGRVNQPAELGRRLGMHHTFGLFFPYQGGRYGTALLSKFPIRSSRTFPLPEGDTLRVALAVELELPDGTTLMVVNIHFDYRADDAFRYSQANTLARWLDSLTVPWILMGDFNDEPDSRTVALFDRRATRAVVTTGSPLTFPTPAPVKEIDFVYLSTGAPWRIEAALVAAEPLASDHRPVVVTLRGRAAND